MASSPAPTRVPWNLDRGRPAGEMGYLPGLDGIRAIAVLGVLLYHADLTWIEGGFLGVDVFFVLSGFLITSLLLEEFDRRGTIDFKRFYIRRARRLLPALFLVLAVVSVMAAFFYRDAAPSVRTDVPAAFFYVTNWWYIAADQSYFEFIGRPAMLQHLWSLAVEEQFYLIWPLVVFGALRWRGRSAVRIVAVVGAVLSTVWMAWLSIRNGYPELADPSRVYFGADSHAMGLLVGAAMATAWRPGRLKQKLAPGGAAVVTGVGIAALLAVGWIYLNVGEFSNALYRGGFLVIAVVVAVLIAAASHPGAPFGRWLGTQPWRYIGERSYGLYLWHWPIFVVTRPDLDIPVEGVWNLLLRLGLTFGVAELSYRYVELPIRHGAIGRFMARWKESDHQTRDIYRRRALVSVGLTVACVTLVGAGLATAPKADENGGLASDVAAAIGVADGGPTSVSLDDPQPAGAGEVVDDGAGPADGGDTDAGPTQDPSTEAGSGSGSGASAEPDARVTKNRNGRLSAIGDSVLLGARVTLQRVIDMTGVDAEVGRQAGGVLARIETLQSQGKLAPTVMIHTGTNGIITESQLRDMLEALDNRQRVVVVNVNVPRRWMDPNNEVIEKVVPDYPNAVIADWKSVSEGHPEYFVSDGVHLTGDGMKAYAKLVKQVAGL
ncbi:MAG: acyltransferase family protein [Candidatus Nanopelagicales bacterium]